MALPQSEFSGSAWYFLLQDRKAVVCHLLILYGTSHEHIIIAISPVFGSTFHETVYTIGEEIEQQVFSNLHHLPALGSPRISIFQKEIRSEACENQLTALNLPSLVTLTLEGKIESGCLSAQAARSITTVHLILTIYIAIPTSGTYLRASMPRIPVGIYAPVLRHYLRLSTTTSASEPSLPYSDTRMYFSSQAMP